MGGEKFLLGCSLLLLSVAVSSVVGTGRGSVELYCYQCTEGEPSQFCNMTSNHQLCRDADDVCFIRVRNEAGSLWSWKGCIRRQTCEEYMAQNGDLCLHGVVTAQCAYCCDGSLCNYDRYTYQVSQSPVIGPSTPSLPPRTPTLPPVTAAPTTPTTTTTTQTPDSTTASIIQTTYAIIYDKDIVTPPPGSCVDSSISQCTDTFRSIISIAVANPRNNLGTLCRTMPNVFMCIAHATRDCCQGNQVDIVKALDFAVQSMWTSCPQDCHTSHGVTCSNHVTERVCRAIIYQDMSTQCQLLRKEVLLYQTCIARTVGACEEKRFVAFNKTLGVLDRTSQIICNGGVIPNTATTTTTTTAIPTTTESNVLPCVVTFTITRDVHQPGATGYNGVYELTQCRAICQQDQSCSGYDFDTNNPPSNGIRCWIHKRSGKLEAYAGVNHYERVRCGQTTTSSSTATTTTTAQATTTSSSPIVTNDQGLPVTTAAPTEDPECKVEDALQCIMILSREVNKAIAGHNNFNIICTAALHLTESCVQEKTATCSSIIQERTQRAMDFVKNFIGDNCYETAPEETCDTTAARTCILELWKLVDEAKDFFQACKKIPETKECVSIQMKGCTDIEKESMNRTLQHVLDKIGNRCDEPIEVMTNQTIRVCEGEDPKYIEYKFLYNPDTLCAGQLDCQIYVDLVQQIPADVKRCKSGEMYYQYALSNGDEENADACSRPITSATWTEVQRVAIAATVDFRRDGDQTRTLTMVMRKVVNGEVVERTTITEFIIEVCDRNMRKPALCVVANDPHLKTFDKRYYNNYYEGFFTLYRHKVLPYEVQVIFQKCHPVASCNCAVAVKVGDFVFFADMCRKKANRCGGGGCRNVLQTHSYVWDKVPAGTRVFRKQGGKIIDVSLPHGTVVRMQVVQHHLNVLVYGSVYDIGQTEGLCGFLDGKPANDLTMPNGRIYNGPGSEKTGQPKPFSNSWRVAKNQLIHHGVPQETYQPQQFCHCSAEGTDGEAALTVNSQCNKHVLLENCHYDKSGEINFDKVPTKTQQEQEQETLPNIPPRVRREVVEYEEEYDVDETYEPKDNPVSPGGWPLANIESFCDSYLTNTFEVSRHCLKVPEFDFDHARLTCIEDIQLTNSTEWAMSALEVLKAQCLADIHNDGDLLDTPAGQDLLKTVEELSCINQCNARGTCNQGVCTCDAGYTGDDCALDADAVPENLFLWDEGLCDSRRTQCEQAVVYGDNFINSDKLTCHIQELKISENGIEETSNFQTVPANYFTFNQIMCQLPKSGSYYIDVSNDAAHSSQTKSLFVGHDSACFDCRLSGTNQASCTRKTTGCMVEGQCYDDGEVSSEDSCYRCDSAKSQTAFSLKSGLGCQPWLFPVILACVGVIILLGIIIACYCLCRRRKASKSEPLAVYEHGKSKKEDEAQMVTVSFDAKPSGESNSSYQNN